MAQPWVIWCGVTVNAPESAPLLDLCEDYGDTADAYYYRAVCWCKKFHRSGRVADVWRELARAIRWPRSPEELRDLWRKHGVVRVGLGDELFDWEEANAAVMRKKEADRLYQSNKRKAGLASAAKRAAKRAALSAENGKKQAAQQKSSSRKVGR